MLDTIISSLIIMQISSSFILSLNALLATRLPCSFEVSFFVTRWSCSLPLCLSHESHYRILFIYFLLTRHLPFKLCSHTAVAPERLLVEAYITCRRYCTLLVFCSLGFSQVIQSAFISLSLKSRHSAEVQELTVSVGFLLVSFSLSTYIFTRLYMTMSDDSLSFSFKRFFKKSHKYKESSHWELDLLYRSYEALFILRCFVTPNFSDCVWHNT